MQSTLRAHLLTRARNLCLTEARGRRRADEGAARLALELVEPPVTPDDEVAGREERQRAAQLGQRIAAMVQSLPDDARTAIWMRFAGEASFEEIAQEIGRPAHAVRALVYRQLAALRERLAQEQP